MLGIKLSQILLLLIFNMPIRNGKESVDYTSENVVVSLEDVGTLEIDDLLNETDRVEYRDHDLQTDNHTVTDFIERKENVSDNNKMEAKIVGGEYANIQDFPHSVFLMAYCNAADNTDYWMCGGSILNQRIILTAAHCVYGCLGHFKIDVLAGSSNYEKAKVLKQVKRLAYHVKYKDDGVFGDIGMVYLNGNLPLSKEIRRVLIRPYFPGLTDGQMAGWGIIDERGTITTKLKVVKQKVWPLSTCQKYESLVRGTFCASSGSNKHYALRGDSGSALVILPDFQELGLVSYRNERYPTIIVYTNVSYYYEWIRTNAHKMHCPSRG